jgi:hypothetical protein
MDKPKWKYDTVTRQHIGMEMVNPDYAVWADERIAALEAEVIALSAAPNNARDEITPCADKEKCATYKAMGCAGPVCPSYPTV